MRIYSRLPTANLASSTQTRACRRISGLSKIAFAMRGVGSVIGPILSLNDFFPSIRVASACKATTRTGGAWESRTGTAIMVGLTC